MEALRIIQEFSSSALELQARREAKSTTVTDIPCDCLEVIMERSSLVDGYKGWACLKGPNRRESQFDTPTWFVAEFKIKSSLQPALPLLERVDSDNHNGRPSGKTVDSSVERNVMEDASSSADAGGTVNRWHAGSSRLNSPLLWSHSCSMLFYEPVLGKHERLDLKLEDNVELPVPHTRHPFYIGGRNWSASDKGLSLFNVLDQRYFCAFGYKFVVGNVINRSMLVLPPIHDSLRRHEVNCNCQTVPLKLVVETEKKGGLKTTASTSFKAYVLEWTRHERECNSNFKIMVYDSMTKLWTRTNAEWVGTSPYTQIFLTSDAIFVSTGRARGSYWGEFIDSFHDEMYKFRNGRVAESLPVRFNPPYEMKEADRYCSNYCEQHGDRDYGSRFYSCGCISVTVFEVEEKWFFFKQTSWSSPYGPNCISAEIWELNDRTTDWRKLPAGPIHLLQTCPRTCKPAYLANVTFTYNGILFVVRHGWFKRNDFLTDFDYIAGWDIAKKAWCTVPQTILDNLPLRRGTFVDRNLADVDNYVFQPSVDRIVGL